MKAEELRSGNIVMYNDIEWVVLSIIYPSLRDDKYSDKWLLELYNGGIITVPIDACKPIPLTEERLTRFGFECISKDRNWHDVRLNRRLNISLNVKTKAVAFSFFGNDWVTMDNYTISYVHQLQNLCHALKGEELTIKQ